MEQKEPVKDRMVIHFVRCDQHDRFSKFCQERQVKWNAGLRLLLDDAEMYRSLMPMMGSIIERLDEIEAKLGVTKQPHEIQTFGGNYEADSVKENEHEN